MLLNHMEFGTRYDGSQLIISHVNGTLELRGVRGAECRRLAVSPASPGALREREMNPAERKERARELLDRTSFDDEKVAPNPRTLTPVSLPPEVVAAKAKLEAARARRVELKRIAGMTVDEHREYINAKAAAKRERQSRYVALRGKQ